MKKTMSSYERTLTAFNRQEPDRVPVDYLYNQGIHSRLLRHFGLGAEDKDKLLECLRVDIRNLSVPYIGPRLHPEVPGLQVGAMQGERTRWVEHSSGGYWDFCEFPLQYADEEQVAAYPLGSPDDFDYGLIPDMIKQYDGYFLAGMFGYGDLINGNGFLRGMEQTLVDLVSDDPAGLLLAKRRFEITLGMWSRAIDAAKKAGLKIHMLCLGEDLGTQRGPIISPAVFEKHIRPSYQPFIDLAKANDMLVMIHSCGSSSWAFPAFVEMGIDVVDTLQPEATNMAPAYLKKTFGHELAFHGMISTAGPLANGSVEDVRREVAETLGIMKPGGGYCLCPTHAIQDNSPTENVLAMYEAAQEFGA